MKKSSVKKDIWNQCDYKIELVLNIKIELDGRSNMVHMIDYLVSHYKYYYACCVHNMDVTIDDEGNEKPREPHFHMVIWSRNSKTNLSLNAFKDEFDIPGNMFQRVTNKVKAIQYLIHFNEIELDKYHYERKDIITNHPNINIYFDKVPSSVPSALVQFLHDDITYYDCITKLSPRDYSKYKTLINNTRDKHNMNRKSRDLQVLYICGESGSGKTTLAKYIADKYNLSCYISSSNNDPLGDYRGEACIVLDDYRSSTFCFNDLLKVIDNHTNSSIHSRYCNKYITDCKLIIITSIKRPSDLYFNDDSAKEEKLEQLYRRINHQYYMIEYTEVNIYNTKDCFVNNTGVDMLDIIPNDFDNDKAVYCL